MVNKATGKKGYIVTGIMVLIVVALMVIDKLIF